MSEPGHLPVHGFVLVGGQSSRMGTDKATLRFCGRPMVEIAVEKLRAYCGSVSLAGNREDLAAHAAVAPERRNGVGPGAGIEAGLLASEQPWAMFLPVDVPLIPADLLRSWAEAVLARPNCSASFLVWRGERQPAFCMLRRETGGAVSQALDAGEKRIHGLLRAADKREEEKDGLWAAEAERFAPAAAVEGHTLDFWFSNVNTPAELARTAAWARGRGRENDILTADGCQ